MKKELDHHTPLPKPVAVTEQEWPEGTRPVVSISCITYNHEKYIRDAIEGFLMQETTFPIEINLHDDASTDTTASIIREYEQKYPNIIKVIYQEENQYSQGVKIGPTFQHPRSNGKYYAPCEGDDYWTDPLKLQKQVEFMEEHEEYSLCAGNFDRIHEDTGRIEKKIKQKYSQSFTLSDFQDYWFTKTLTVLLRKNSFSIEQIPNYKYFRDNHLFYHLLKQGKGYYFSDVFGVYRIHKGGVHSLKEKKYQRKMYYEIHKELYFKNRDDFTRRHYLKSLISLLREKVQKGGNIKESFLLLREFLKNLKKKSDIKYLINRGYTSFKEKINT